MFLLAVIAISLGLFSVGEGAVTYTAPGAADGPAATAIPEAQTAAFKVQDLTLASTAHNLNGLSIISVDGSNTAANWKFELANTAQSFATSELQTKANAGFDYEMQPSYVVILEITDDEPSTASVTLTVAVEDADDNAPTFDYVTKCGAVPALSDNGFVAGNYPATDLDGTSTNRVTAYAITGGDDTGNLKFGASPAGGVIQRSANALDAATKSVYSLVLEAQGPSNTATTTIIVTVGGTCPACGSGAQGITSAASIVASLLGFMLYQFV